ncbi:MAG: hypothetical protein K0V04_25325 [Deltaproteobacteria bacterium]|nr:hypothetical protein [Deltaproteobacteria bacterium]
MRRSVSIAVLGLAACAADSEAPAVPQVESGTLLLQCSLDGAQTVQSPAVGSGAGASAWTQPPDHFVQSLDGLGLLLDADGQWLRFPANDPDAALPNIDLAHGTLSFWLRPAFPVLDGQQRNLFAALDEQGRGLRIAKAGRDDDNALMVELIDTAGEQHVTTIAADSLPWLLLAWERVRVGWDTSGDTEQNVRVWVDDRELPYAEASAGPVVLPRLTVDTDLYWGAWAIEDSNAVRGTFDNLEIWAGIVPPSTDES